VSTGGLSEAKRQKLFAVQDVIDAASVLRDWVSRADLELLALDSCGRDGLLCARAVLSEGWNHLQRASKDARLAGRRGVALEWLRALTSIQQEAREMYGALEAAIRIVSDRWEGGASE
jgi:hypothetical protein